MTATRATDPVIGGCLHDSLSSYGSGFVEEEMCKKIEFRVQQVIDAVATADTYSLGKELRDIKKFIRYSSEGLSDIPLCVFDPEKFIDTVLPVCREPNIKTVVVQCLAVIAEIVEKLGVRASNVVRPEKLPMERLVELVGTGKRNIIKQVLKLLILLVADDSSAASSAFQAVPMDVIERHLLVPKYGQLYIPYAMFLCEIANASVPKEFVVRFAVLVEKFAETVNIRANKYALSAIGALFRGDKELGDTIVTALHEIPKVIDRIVMAKDNDDDLMHCAYTFLGRVAMCNCAMPHYRYEWLLENGIFHRSVHVQQAALFALYNMTMGLVKRQEIDPGDLFTIIRHLCRLAVDCSFIIYSDLLINIPSLCSVLPTDYYYELVKSGVFACIVRMAESDDIFNTTTFVRVLSLVQRLFERAGTDGWLPYCIECFNTADGAHLMTRIHDSGQPELIAHAESFLNSAFSDEIFFNK